MLQTLVSDYSYSNFKFDAIPLYPGDDPIKSEIHLISGFTNDDPNLCPIEFTIVQSDGTALSNGLENAFSVTVDDYI